MRLIKRKEYTIKQKEEINNNKLYESLQNTHTTQRYKGTRTQIDRDLKSLVESRNLLVGEELLKNDCSLLVMKLRTEASARFFSLNAIIVNLQTIDITIEYPENELCRMFSLLECAPVYVTHEVVEEYAKMLKDIAAYMDQYNGHLQKTNLINVKRLNILCSTRSKLKLFQTTGILNSSEMVRRITENDRRIMIIGKNAESALVKYQEVTDKLIQEYRKILQEIRYYIALQYYKNFI